MKGKIERDSLLGCIKYKDVSNFYLMPIAWWILDYKRYDPNYNPADWAFIFRDNILTVSDNEIDHYVKEIRSKKVELEHLPKSYVSFVDLQLHFFIDFDKKELISSFEYIEVEEYLPDTNWKGKFDNPVGYLPDTLKAAFIAYGAGL